MKIGFIGAGKVGFSLGKLFVEGNVQVTGYYSRHLESAAEAAKFTNTTHYENLTELIKDSDGIFITTPDGVISEVYDEIKDMGIREKQICHCSGAMTAREAFPDAQEHGAYTYSIHPLFPVSSKFTSYQEMTGAFFCIEGSDRHLDEWASRIQALGATPKVIDGAKKVSYHAACVMASNLVCALMNESMGMLQDCGFSEEDSRRALEPLAKANLNRIFQVGPVDALTGPVERCDEKTIEKHLESFVGEKAKSLYVAASQSLVDMAAKRHPETDYENMSRLLQDGKLILSSRGGLE